MTDNEIIKALECHIKGQCYSCPNAKEEIQLLHKPCSRMIAENALDLIKRQKGELAEERAKNGIAAEVIARQNAEIGEFKCYKSLYIDLEAEYLETIRRINKFIETAKAEAVKEFAERLKEKNRGKTSGCVGWVDFDDIDNILKEMGVEG